MNEVGRELFNTPLALLGCRVQIKVLGVVLQLSFDWEDVRAKFDVFAVWSKQVLESELRLPNGEFGFLFIFGSNVLITVVQVNLDQVSCQHLLK